MRDALACLGQAQVRGRLGVGPHVKPASDAHQVPVPNQTRQVVAGDGLRIQVAGTQDACLFG